MTWLAGECLWRNSHYAAYFSFFSIIVLFVTSHLWLLDTTRRGVIVRCVLLFPTLYFIADLAYNPRHSFGSALRDLAFGVISWHTIAKALDVGLVYTIEGKPPPRWCVPDWSKEAKEENSVVWMDISSPKSSKKMPFWKRTPILRRPRWAIETNTLPAQWRLLPLPTRFIDQLVWAIDVMTLRRHGSSFLFQEEMRALEWSQGKLQKAAQAQKQESWSALSRKQDPSIIPFGYSETSWSDALLQTVAVVWAVQYIMQSDIPASSPNGFYNLALSQQWQFTLAMGILISFATDLPERLGFKVLQGWPFFVPCTALSPHFRNVVRSKTLTDMWAHRWHTISRRDFVRLGALLPIFNSMRAAAVLKTFFWSALFHSVIFIRLRPIPTLSDPVSFLVPFYLSGAYGLFIGQGILVILENGLLPIISSSRLYQRSQQDPRLARIFSILQSVYVYTSLIWMARWFVASIVSFGLLEQASLRTMSLQAQWADYTNFWRQRGQIFPFMSQVTKTNPSSLHIDL